ncbi:MAG: PEP-CTERM sorting domain-containing protein [Phycisphaeraceae bacterium]|nr:PEP-CTERM sorting domain-containing protein [Phycisphaeraceae bacterium]
MISKQSTRWFTPVLVIALCTVAAQADLVAHWNFDDDTYNDQVGTLHGTAVGTTAIVTAGNNQLGADMGKALQTGGFFGLDYVFVGDLATLGVTGSFTLSSWIMHDLIPVENTISPEFWDSYSNGTGGGVVQNLFRGNGGTNAGKPYTTVSDMSTGVLFKPEVRIDDNLWHWVAFVYDADTNSGKIFLDGVHHSGRDRTGAFTLHPTTSKITRIGDGFGGLVDDVRIYNEALSWTADENDNLLSGGLYDVWTVGAPTQHPGDANGDGLVNLSDLQILGDNWQSTTATWAQADFTDDGIVNLADLQILGDNWGFGTSPDVSFDEALAGVVIPEPVSLVLLLSGAGALALRRRGCRWV